MSPAIETKTPKLIAPTPLMTYPKATRGAAVTAAAAPL